MTSVMQRLIAIALVAALIVALGACAPGAVSHRSTTSAAFSFALVGDAPYSTAAEGRFAAMLRQINDDASLSFVLHAGDIKGGGEPCSDALLQRRLAQFDEVRTALVYTPGDNEWTDCHRPAAGAFHPLERLAALRRFAYPNPRRSFGRRPLAVRSQADVGAFHEFVENARFVHGQVVFVTLHVVGSNNGLDPWYGIDRDDRRSTPRAERLAEFKRRQAANLAWLELAFAQAESLRAAAVVVLMQANPRFELGADHPKQAGFRAVVDALRRHARRFARPVLLAHGDRHLFLVDHPMSEGEPPLPTLKRVQTYGDPWTLWVRVHVDPDYDEVFTIRSGGPLRSE